ncbi:hypothetical protein A3L09_10690 (plasmid) [Thermococcus profundus]|uniref:ORC1-type DNA replication protein n=1 Tax=Thermococcus profundus TaxID=49899 RepID=A0A2Z2MBK3_THEPR|nr:AAA family ATPase [Thermococcus profundus]ASJ03817.1 hypothetical protein A3L09_10690 [Thermococcus profundus]
MRIKDILQKFESTHQLLVHPEVLSESYIPPRLLFREKEIEDITKHAASFLFQGININVIIYGEPGVGKTVAVRQLEQDYNDLAREKNINSRAIYISVKDLTHRNALLALARELGVSGLHGGMSTADVYDKLLEFLRTSNMRYLFIMDEIDKMRKKEGDLDGLIYSLTRINERAGKVAVSNFFVTNNAVTLERLSAPTFSSLSPVLVYFRNYDAEELYAILKDRVEQAFVPGAVDDAAIRLLAALIRRQSRDLRWAFMVLREAATLGEDKITEKTIWAAIDRVERSVIEQIIMNLDTDALLLLHALAAMSIEKKEVSSSELYLRYRDIANALDWDYRTMKHVINYIGAKLESEGLLTRRVVSRGRYGRTHMFQLQEDPFLVKNITTQVIQQKLHQKPEIS